MDERDLIRSIISHVNLAQSQVESLLASDINAPSKNELQQAGLSLNDCIRHCHGIFGPTTIRDRRRL